MSNEGGSYQRVGKKGRVWVPDGSDAAAVLAEGEGEAAHDQGAAKPKPKRKPAAKSARKRKA
jgi:hypothetical protein